MKSVSIKISSFINTAHPNPSVQCNAKQKQSLPVQFLATQPRCLRPQQQVSTGCCLSHRPMHLATLEYCRRHCNTARCYDADRVFVAVAAASSQTLSHYRTKQCERIHLWPLLSSRDTLPNERADPPPPPLESRDMRPEHGTGVRRRGKSKAECFNELLVDAIIVIIISITPSQSRPCRLDETHLDWTC